MEVNDLLEFLELDDYYCGVCNKFVGYDKFMCCDNIDDLFEYCTNTCGLKGICIYCNEKLLNNDFYNCKSCKKVSDLTNKDTFCPCLKNKDVKIRNYDKINEYISHTREKENTIRYYTGWEFGYIETINIKDLMNIPKGIANNIVSITKCFEKWWWKIDAENCLCEDCRKRLLLENSHDDSNSDDDSND